MSDAPPPPAGRPGTERASVLERELGVASERIAALATSNAEYKAVNEELQSANEALLASREEYQSINQELQTINGELAERLAALARANDEASTILHATRLAVLLLDGGGRLKGFTPRAAELFALDDAAAIPRATTLGPHLSYPDLEADLGAVLLTAQPAERRLSTTGGVRCLARMLPHRAASGAMAGVVLVFLETG